ncbi:hypothetical protein EC9_51720 [Rosistilla ulvae]|uniref:Uncharacterized protein n=1 Tax=Rosistilla ulvae TaxID=1930277 RepID=A0A517M7U8_9BACT|nr:hypothetical protein EC9_51720 [Rosistilla ulvae]
MCVTNDLLEIAPGGVLYHELSHVSNTMMQTKQTPSHRAPGEKAAAVKFKPRIGNDPPIALLLLGNVRVDV